MVVKSRLWLKCDVAENLPREMRLSLDLLKFIPFDGVLNMSGQGREPALSPKVEEFSSKVGYTTNF